MPRFGCSDDARIVFQESLIDQDINRAAVKAVRPFLAGHLVKPLDWNAFTDPQTHDYQFHQALAPIEFFYAARSVAVALHRFQPTFRITPSFDRMLYAV